MKKMENSDFLLRSISILIFFLWLFGLIPICPSIFTVPLVHTVEAKELTPIPTFRFYNVPPSLITKLYNRYFYLLNKDIVNRINNSNTQVQYQNKFYISEIFKPEFTFFTMGMSQNYLSSYLYENSFLKEFERQMFVSNVKQKFGSFTFGASYGYFWQDSKYLSQINKLVNTTANVKMEFGHQIAGVWMTKELSKAFDVTLSWNYSPIQDKLNTNNKGEVVYQEISANIRPVRYITVTPSLGIGKYNYSWLGYQTRTQLASLSLSCSEYLRTLDLWFWGGWSRGTDIYQTYQTFDACCGLNWAPKLVSSLNITFSFELGYSKYKDDTYQKNSSEGYSCFVLLKMR